MAFQSKSEAQVDLPAHVIVDAQFRKQLCEIVFTKAFYASNHDPSHDPSMPVGFKRRGKLVGAERKLLQYSAISFIDRLIFPEYGEELRDQHDVFGIPTVLWVLSPQHVLQVVCDLVVGLLVPSAPLPPDTLFHHAVLHALWSWQFHNELDAEIDMDEQTVKETPDAETMALRKKRCQESKEARESDDPSAHDAMLEQWRRENQLQAKKSGKKPLKKAWTEQKKMSRKSLKDLQTLLEKKKRPLDNLESIIPYKLLEQLFAGKENVVVQQILSKSPEHPRKIIPDPYDRVASPRNGKYEDCRNRVLFYNLVVERTRGAENILFPLPDCSNMAQWVCEMASKVTTH